MNIVNKIISSVQDSTGLPCYYEDAGRLNYKLDYAQYPCAFFTLINDGNIITTDSHYRESVNVAIFFVKPTTYDFDSIDNENIIEECKGYALKWLNSLLFNKTLESSVFNTERVYNYDDSILTGFALNLRITELFGLNCLNPLIPEDRKKTIKLFVNPESTGTVNGEGKYIIGSSATISANPNEGYKFVNWTINEEELTTDNPYTFIVEDNVNITANFDNAEVYTITATGSNCTIEGAGEYFEGSVCDLTCTPDDGYRFINWTEDDIELSTEASISILVDEDRTLVANVEIIPGQPETKTKLQNYLYEFEYDNLNYEEAYNYFSTISDNIVGGCSMLRKDNLIGRNLDWYYSNLCDFVVHTPATATRKEVVGLCGGINALTESFVSSTDTSYYYVVLPFQMQDGINDSGLYASYNVVPTDYGKNISLPTISQEVEINALMLVRYVLDKFDNAYEAAYYIREHCKVYFPKTLHDMNYELQLTIADNDATFCVDFVENEAKVIEITEKPIMTNFHLYNTILNNDGTVYIPATQDSEHSATRTNQITEYGSGLERWNIINNSLSIASVRNILDSLTYSRVYITNPEHTQNYDWYTEFVGDDLTVDSNVSDFSSIVQRAGELYESRDRNNPNTWQTLHSSIYDTTNLSLVFRAQEGTTDYTYQLTKPEYTITASGSNITITGYGTYDRGDTCTLIAAPDSHYRFLGWYENDVLVSENLSYSFTVVKDRTFTARTELITYNVSIVYDDDICSVSGAGVYTEGDTVSIECTPIEGYKFEDWSVPGEMNIDDNPYTFVIDEDKTFTANVIYNPTSMISATPNPANSGTISGTGEYDNGDTCTLTATPNSGFEFVDWKENDTIISTSNPYSFTVENDRSFIADFKKSELTFTALQNNSTVKVVKGDNAPTVNLQYSIDKGTTWNTYNIGSSITLSTVGSSVKFRGTNNKMSNAPADINANQFNLTGSIKASGCLISLLKNGTSDNTLTSTNTYAFANLFINQTALTNINELIMPTTTAIFCYYRMFMGCTGLTSIPSGFLSATTLAQNCYQGMFRGCSLLSSVPTDLLPATTTATYCYSDMFNGCSKLTVAPYLPASTLSGNDCYGNMFQGCTSLSSIHVKFTSWDNNRTSNWVYNVRSTGTFYCPSSLPKTVGSSSIPSGWTVQNWD